MAEPKTFADLGADGGALISAAVGQKDYWLKDPAAEEHTPLAMLADHFSEFGDTRGEILRRWLADGGHSWGDGPVRNFGVAPVTHSERGPPSNLAEPSPPVWQISTHVYVDPEVWEHNYPGQRVRFAISLGNPKKSRSLAAVRVTDAEARAIADGLPNAAEVHAHLDANGIGASAPPGPDDVDHNAPAKQKAVVGDETKPPTGPAQFAAPQSETGKYASKVILAAYARLRAEGDEAGCARLREMCRKVGAKTFDNVPASDDPPAEEK